jgi:transposase-like protein
MSRRKRRHHSPEQKAELLRRHLVDKVPVSEICTEAQIQPSIFYKWQRDLLEAAPALFAREKGAPNRERELEDKVEGLRAKLARKDAIIAEVSEEYVKLKKELGEL